MPNSNFDLEFSDDGRIVDFLDGTLLEKRPEELVRQRFLRVLHFEYNYPKGALRREVPIFHGASELRDAEGRPVRADIVVYHSVSAANERDQGQIRLVVECKAPNVTEGYNQLVSYVYNTSAEGGVWYNGSGDREGIEYYRRESAPLNALVPWIGIPRATETWDALGRRKKTDLVKARDIKGLLRRCHNRLHGRGAGGEEEDLTMDMVRILLAKAQDEERPGEYPDFYCTPEEYASETGRAAVAGRVARLFDEAKRLNSAVFSEHEAITVSARAVCDVVIELQAYQLVADLHDAHDWDVMGAAYEQYTSSSLRRERGQFFTNRLVVNFLVSALDPEYTDKILDPAGGSGGFLTGAMRHVRKKILNSNDSEIAKKRQLDRFKNHLFMVEQSKRLVKVAKTAMILNGDGHAGMTAGDSLGPFEQFDETIVAQASRSVPSIVLTNPPFAGVGEGRITEAEVLRRFRCGKRWEVLDGVLKQTNELVTAGVPPELLFFERCIDWLAPGGKLGIVMPKSFADTNTYWPGRALLFEQCQLLAIINCHKDTFQPHTGVRTSLLLLRKYAEGESRPEAYDIFMAVSRKIGQDSEGAPIFVRDENGKPTDRLDHDLDEIASAYGSFCAGELIESQYVFSVSSKDVDDHLRINPQRFLPHLNETIEAITRLDGVDGWSVSALGQLEANIRVFKGPRLTSAPLVVEERTGQECEKYYTPGAVLQEKSDSVKWLDLSRANERQRKTIDSNRVHENDIVITRSGAIGRVAYIGRHLENAIVSDDLIRVRIANARLRLFVYNYLQSRYAQDQMSRNEYGAVQQHLEPNHVSDLLVALPADWDNVEELLAGAEQLIEKKEQVHEISAKLLNDVTDLIGSAIAGAEQIPEA